jgi:O-antigen/teichoic acid export membrane protein
VKFFHNLKNSKQVQNFSIYGIGQLFNLLTPLLVAPYVIIICGEEGFGKSGIGLSFVFILTVLVDFASGIKGVKDVSVFRDDTKKVQKIGNILFSIKLITLLLILFFATIAIILIPFLYQEKELFFLSLVFLVSQAFNPTWFLQGLEKFKIISALSISGKILYIFLVLTLVTTKGDYVYVNFYLGISALFVHLIGMGWLIKNKFLVLEKPEKPELISIFSRDYKLTLSQLLLSLQQYSPILIVGFFGNSSLAGQYKIIEQIIMIFRTYLQVLFNFIFPRVCFLLAKDHKLGIRNWKIFNGANFFLILIGCLILFVFAPEVLGFFNATNSKELTFYLRFASFSPLFFALSIPLQQLVLGYNYQKQYVNITTTAAVFLIVTIIAVFSFWQLIGIFSILILTEVIVIIMYLYTLRKNLFNNPIS